MRFSVTEMVIHQEVAADVVSVHEAISHLSALYPDFDRWYWGKVVPESALGTRRIDTVTRDGRVVAVAISKKTDTERKLCTLWVKEEIKGGGHGVRLIRRACEWLGTDIPHATVPEEHIHELGPVLERLGWVETGRTVSVYRPGMTEYIFNRENGSQV
ncbi:hypothetical protein HFN89_03180 [Rhizobium laguerreae]|nr:hypothetical protein [Rhizobium laguerreae]